MIFHYRSRQCLRSLAAGLLLGILAGCSAPPRTAAPGTGAGEVDVGVKVEAVPSRLTPKQATDVTFHALNLVGTPYRYGGNTPESGFDCSGLIGYVYQKTGGFSLPRSVAGLQYAGTLVPAEGVRAGDLVVFGREGASSHAGIYVGEGRFVHAPSSGGDVRLDSLKSKYWSSQRVTFRRP